MDCPKCKKKMEMVGIGHLDMQWVCLNEDCEQSSPIFTTGREGVNIEESKSGS